MSMVMERRGAESSELEYKQFDVFLVNLGLQVGSVQSGLRPMMIISNDIANKHSPCVIAVPLTSKLSKAKLPTHVLISKADCDIEQDSIIMYEQHFTLEKSQLPKSNYLFSVPCKYIDRLDRANYISTKSTRSS